MIFQNIILGIIIFNAALMGLQTISGLSPEDESSDLSAELDALKEHIAKIEKLLETKK